MRMFKWLIFILFFIQIILFFWTSCSSKSLPDANDYSLTEESAQDFSNDKSDWADYYESPQKNFNDTVNKILPISFTFTWVLVFIAIGIAGSKKRKEEAKKKLEKEKQETKLPFIS